MSKGKPNKRYTGEFKQIVVETITSSNSFDDVASTFTALEISFDSDILVSPFFKFV